ncbi:delta-60 repeat domain-containing protein [Flavobacterium sp. C4GT6]|uniref:delta-60 repeat domain-containing protein n=1 Tax=Flavobacterium sp. C4GT6 TaxID=3103818 RepID=UPI002ED129C8
MYKILPALLLFSSSLFSQNYIVDESFYQGSGIFSETEVTSMLELPDNKIFVSFITTVNYYGINNKSFFVINENGSLSSSFFCGSCLSSGNVDHSLLAGDKIIIAGNFSSYNGVDRKYIAKVNLDGSLDTTFNANILSDESLVYYISKIDLYESDGPIYDPKIYISGYFRNLSFDIIANPLLRLNFNGSLDTSFNLDDSLDDLIIRNFTVLDDGKILVEVTDLFDDRFILLNNDGSIHTDFSNLEFSVYEINSMLILDDGKLLVAGRFYLNSNEYILLKFNVDGSIDESFPLYNHPYENVPFFGYELVKHNDGIYFSGKFDSFYGSSIDDFVLLNSDGTLNSNFDMGGVSEEFGYDTSFISTVLPLSNGKIMIGGEFYRVNGEITKVMARLQPANLNVDKYEMSNDLIVYSQSETTYFNSINNSISSIQFYDISGRLIDSTIVNSDTYSCTLPNNSLILYRIFLNDGAIVTGKVIR